MNTNPLILDFLKVVCLAVLQGVAEFLPISSSGHLVAAQHLLHFSVPGISLELALHAGTLVAVCVYYFGTIRDLVVGALHGSRRAWLYIAAVVLSMIPCAFVLALVGDWFEHAFENIRFVGPALLFTGILLLTTRRGEATPDGTPPGGTGVPPVQIQNGQDARSPAVPPKTPSLPVAFLIGVGQAVAMLPGVSRSGTTIWVARLCRVDPAEAARFSFLMSVPVIAGGCLLEVLDCIAPPESMAAAEAAAPLPAWMLGAGAVIAALVGYASLSLLVKLLSKGRFWVFGVYCLAVGAAILIWA